MNRGADRLSRVVEDLLLLAKVGDPQQGIIPADVDLVRVVDEVTDLVARHRRRKELVLHVERPAGPVVARGDATEIDRLVSNLVSNAVKYTPEGRRIAIRVLREDDRVRIEVTDEGLGISAADQEHLFDEFFRSSNPEAVRQPGTGLGLAIVKRIVERHGGDIVVESELGSGQHVHRHAAGRQLDLTSRRRPVRGCAAGAPPRGRRARTPRGGDLRWRRGRGCRGPRRR